MYLHVFLQKAGCDNVLGSSARRDVCGVCRGNGESCKLIQGTFTIPQLYSGKFKTRILIDERDFLICILFGFFLCLPVFICQVILLMYSCIL